MQPPRTTLVDPLSLVSLFVEVLDDSGIVAKATGFIIEHEGAQFLITNWHVVTGLDSVTNKDLTTGIVPREPMRLRIVRHSRAEDGWIRYTTCSIHALRDPDGRPYWLEHPLGRRVDVIALPLGEPMYDVVDFPIDAGLAEVDMHVACGTTVSIVGFPLGIRVERLPVWKTGHIASEPEVDVDDLPMFLVDATTRSGMSGSPVYARATGTYMTRNRRIVMATGTPTRFLGVYSGRLHHDAEIGRVWKPRVISEIFEAAT